MQVTEDQNFQTYSLFERQVIEKFVLNVKKNYNSKSKKEKKITWQEVDELQEKIPI